MEEFVFVINGMKVEAGDTVIDFRGQVWKFKRISRNPGGPSTGRVLVEDTDVPEGKPFRTREFFPNVFSGEIMPAY